MTQSPLSVTLFTDFLSPHGYVAEAALREAVLGRDAEIRYRALEMYPPGSPLPPATAVAELVTDAAPDARLAGLPLSAPSLVPRTRKAHEASRIAAAHALEGPLRDAILRAYWADDLDIGRIDVLSELASRVGIDPEDVRIALDIDRFGDAVREDAALARRLNVRHVPTMYIGTGPEARILVGLQTQAALDAALRSG